LDEPEDSFRFEKTLINEEEDKETSPYGSEQAAEEEQLFYGDEIPEIPAEDVVDEEAE
jgi:hypothetical protein